MNVKKSTGSKIILVMLLNLTNLALKYNDYIN